MFPQNYSGELNYLVALHELYKYINKYYDQVMFLWEILQSRVEVVTVGVSVCEEEMLSCLQIITALEEDTTAQKMQLGYRLQQIAAAVENKVTDL